MGNFHEDSFVFEIEIFDEIIDERNFEGDFVGLDDDEALDGMHRQEIRRALEAKGRSLAAAKISAARYAVERSQLVEAAQILSNPATRAAYDAARAAVTR